MGLDVLLPVLGLALVDSINPSALVATLYLLTLTHPTGRVLMYISGVFLTYFSLGCALMLGLRAVLERAGAFLETPLAFTLQGLIGVALIAYSFWADKKHTAGASTRPSSPGLSNAAPLIGVFLLGITVTLTEFVTALPYLGAVGVLTNAGLGVSQWLPVLVVYNLIFVAPPLALLVLHRWAGAWFQRRFADGGAGLRRSARDTVLWIIGAVGVLLVLDTVRGLGVFDYLNLTRSSRER